MKNSINRRSWLKASLGLASGVAITPALVNTLMAHPMSAAERTYFQQFGQQTPLIKLNANENPYGPSQKARKAINEILNEGNRYPFQVVNDLKQILSQKEGVAPEYIAVGAGSGELLCATGAAFGVQQGSILAPNPTFPMLMAFSEVFGSRWDKVDLNEKLEVDYASMISAIKADTRLAFVCNPNNPTGTLVARDIVKGFCEEASKKTTVFSDEAYLEFLEPAQQSSMVDLVKNGANVIVSRTFSKVYGLAGLRIGYIVAHPDIIKNIARYQTGFSVNQTAIAAAKAVSGDTEFMEMTRRKNAEARKVLTDFLTKRGYFFGESYTNFVFFDPKGDAQNFMTKLAAKGIAIRVWDYQNKQWNRVSVGTTEEMKTLVKSMEEILS
jgi:histidinol-phosphate aminotransferase